MLRLEMKPLPPAVRPSLAVSAGLLFALLAIVCAVPAASARLPIEQRLMAALFTGVMLVPALLLLRAARARPVALTPLCLAGGMLELPLPVRPVRPARSGRVPLEVVEAQVVRGGRLLVIRTLRGAVPLPAERFVDADAIPRFVAALAVAQAELAAAPAAVEPEVAAARAIVREVVHAPRRVTAALVATLVLAGAVQLVATLLTGEEQVLALGANAPVLVREGQLYRVVTASLLHGGWVHFYFNVMAISSLAASLEGLIGGWRLALVYLVAVMAAGLTTVIAARSPFSVGASGGAFGLLGALAWFCWRHRRELPPGLVPSRRAWTVNVVANLLINVLVPRIDVAAHVGGLLAGTAVTALLYRRGGPLKVAAPAGRAVRAAVAALLVAALASIVALAVHAHRVGDGWRREVERAVIGLRLPGRKSLP